MNIVVADQQPTDSAPDAGPVEGLSQAEAAYRGLRELVRKGAYTPGELLSEGAIAERLGVGRTPIREAVSRLAHEGLLIRMPKRGVVVATLSADDVRELYDVHGALESFCVRSAIERGQGAELAARLAGIVDSAEERVRSGISWREYRVEDRRFHHALWSAGDNRRAADILGASSDAAILDPWFHQLADLDGQQERSIVEHRVVAGAVASGDADIAAEAIWNHHRSYQRQLARRLFGLRLGEEKP